MIKLNLEIQIKAIGLYKTMYTKLVNLDISWKCTPFFVVKSDIGLIVWKKNMKPREDIRDEN